LDPGETDPTNADTDGDGVSDLIENAAGTDPTDSGDNPQQNGDFVFVEPYQQPPSPTDDVLDFSTSFKALDLMFTEDISGSMSDAINSIRNTLTSTLNDIICDPGEDPNLTGCVPSVESGVQVFGGRYTDNGLNIQCDGSAAISTQCLVKKVDSDNTQTQRMLPSHVGGGSEYDIGALWNTIKDTCSSESQSHRPGMLPVPMHSKGGTGWVTEGRLLGTQGEFP